jgi:hypothetical protein
MFSPFKSRLSSPHLQRESAIPEYFLSASFQKGHLVWVLTSLIEVTLHARLEREAYIALLEPELISEDNT